jgi:hypothetical protein
MSQKKPFDRPKYMADYMKRRRARVGLIRRLLASLASEPNKPAAGWPYPWAAVYVQAVEAAQAVGLTRGETVQALTTAKAGNLAPEIAREVVNACWSIPQDPADEDTSADDEARHLAELNRGYARDRI